MTSRVWLCVSKKREGFQISGLDVWMDANVSGTLAYVTVADVCLDRWPVPIPAVLVQRFQQRSLESAFITSSLMLLIHH